MAILRCPHQITIILHCYSISHKAGMWIFYLQDLITDIHTNKNKHMKTKTSGHLKLNKSL